MSDAMRYLAVLLTALLLFAGCAGPNLYPVLQKSLQAGDCHSALELINNSRKRYGHNAELLYLLDSAMVGMQCGDYLLVQERLQAADALAEKLWTESISRNIAAMVTNDYTLPYAGEDYERVLIHIVSAIGYMQTDQPDEALVEIRRLDALLNMYDAEYKDAEVYKADAFGRYLSGMLHESDNAFDDAYIDYQRAVEIYRSDWQRYGTKLPDILIQDFERMAMAVNRLDDAKQLVPQSNPNRRALDRWASATEPDAGKVVLIVFNGEGPHKTQDIFVAQTLHGPVSVAFPRIVTGDTGCRGGYLQLSNGTTPIQAKLATVSDINQIALKNLEDRKGRIVAKAVARAIAKQVAIEKLADSGKTTEQKRTTAALLNVANMLLLEKADTRCWRTLPGSIHMARAMVAPGEYQGRLIWCGSRIDLGTIRVASGETRFLFADTRYNMRQAADPQPIIKKKRRTP